MKLRIKKFLIFCLLLIFFVNTLFATVVSDNDGSAFITTTEFDTLRSDFQAKINDFNTSIDNKIEEAISAYLSGITVKAEQVSVLNNLYDSGYGFVGKWVLPNPTLGTAYRSLYAIKFYRGMVSTANTLGEINITSTGEDWYEYNISDKAHYLYGQIEGDDDTTDTTKWNFIITKTIESFQIESVKGSFTSGSDSGYNNSTSTVGSPNNTFAKPNEYDSSGNLKTQYQGVYNLNWTHSNFFGKNISIPVTVGFNFNDVTSDFDSCRIPGAKIDETNTYYFIKDKEINALGTLRNYCYPNNTYYKKYYTGTTGSATFDPSKSDSDQNAWVKGSRMECYNHKYTSMKLTKVLNKKVSDIMNDNIYYYQGVPIFKNTKNGKKLTMKLKFENNLNKKTYFVVQKTPFSNQSISKTATSTIKIGNTLVANSGSTITFVVDGDCKKEEIYWIKAIPEDETSITKIKTESIIIE